MLSLHGLSTDDESTDGGFMLSEQFKIEIDSENHG